MAKSRYICGVHAVGAALENTPEKIRTLWVQHKCQNPRLDPCLAAAKRLGLPVQRTSVSTLDHYTNSARHQGIVAELAVIQAPALNQFLENIDLAKKPLLLAIDAVEDPHNLGACLRSAEAFGADGVILPKNRGTNLTATVSKVACGASERLTIFEVSNLARALKDCQSAGFWVYGTHLEAQHSPAEQDLSGPVVIVLGAEEKGIRQLTQAQCDMCLKIPLAGHTQSLNVSVACGVMLYECSRQRKSK